MPRRVVKKDGLFAFCPSFGGLPTSKTGFFARLFPSMSVFCYTIKKHLCTHFTSEHNNHTHRQVTNQLKSGVGASLTVEKRCTGTKEEALFNILKGRSFSFCCALRAQEKNSPCGRIHTRSFLCPVQELCK